MLFKRKFNAAAPWDGYVKFRLAFKYFVDTINHTHMGRTKAQAEHQKSRA
jgi:hypothetical protein